MTHIDDIRAYVARVQCGDRLACKWERLACERFVKDLDRQGTDAFPYVFDEKKAARVCTVIENFKHIKGKWANTPIVLEGWQKFIVGNVFGWVHKDTKLRRFRTVYIEVPRKNAKALSLETEIPTPDGFKLMRDLHVGDYVFDDCGNITKIVAESEVFTNHDCYELEFSTGEKIVADAGHLWITDSRRDRDRKKGKNNKNSGAKPSVKTTEEISQTIKCRHECNHRIANAKPLNLPNKDLIVAPYALGIWLGDGHSASGRFTCSFSDSEEILEYLNKCSEPANQCNSGSTETAGLFLINGGDRRHKERKKSFQARLRQLGVLNNKHIPIEYFRSSYKQRLELLRGLMDSDGTITKAGQCSFTTINRTLADDVWHLIATLGFKPSMDIQPAMLSGKRCGTAFRVQFWAYSDTPVFNLIRKSNRQKQTPKKLTRTAYRQIISAEKIDSVPVKCIAVDSPNHTFLVGRSCIPTHNSTLTSAVGLYMMALDGEGGAEVYSAATNRDQAKIVFRDAQAMARKSPEFCQRFGVEVRAHNINQIQTDSKFEALSADANSLDGLNVHFGGIDELHAHKTREVFDVIETATGARTQSILWLITTAGFDRTAICYEQRTYVTKILDGVSVDETYFGIIYTIDDGDSWDDPSVWEKANPNYGVSLFPEDIARLCDKAKAMPSAQNNFLTKRLNVWVNARTAWMDMRCWDACGNKDLTIDMFRGEPCYIGLDLASKIDIAALVTLFYKDNKYYLFGKYYLPEETAMDSGNSQYSGWDIEGRLTLTPGNIIDFEYIENDLLELCSAFEVQEIPYDPFQATQFATRMMAQGLPMVELRATVQNFSEPMKALQALVMEKRLVHDGDPVMAWMASNVVAKLDIKENIYPCKERPENKIDGIVAAIAALNRAMFHEQDAASVYEERGILTL